jgi:predicted metalloprotease with PDZ domain
MGNLGIRRETIAGTRVAIAAPEGQNVRRMDMLALLNWVLPELGTVLPDAIPRLTVVSAGDPMWRGGLSAPSSIFIHASRPLISENATSTLVHELVHVAMSSTAESGFDWIVEGLAEYYSLELLQRGGAITARRYQRALEKQSEWAASANTLCAPRSTGATTALAVVTFRDLDKEIREKSAGQFSLDNVLTQVSGARARVNLGAIEAIVSELIQGPSDTLAVDKLPGCKQNASISET